VLTDNTIARMTWLVIAFSLVTTSSLKSPAQAVAAENDQFRVRAGQRQLFLDDHGIVKIEGLRRTMHRPAKRGAVIRSPNPEKTIQTRTAPVWDPQAKLYKLWVLTIEENLWQSQDGLHWTPGPKTNMRISMAVYDPRESDDSRQFKAPLLNQGFAVSGDGINWTKVEEPGIPASDEGNFSFDAENGLFIHTVKRGGNYGRSVAVATSRDFKTWDDFGIVFQADDRDQELGKANIKARMTDRMLNRPPYNDPDVYNVDVYNMGAFRYEGLYIGMPAMYHATGAVPNYPNTVGFHLVQLVCSRDLKEWKRLGDRQTFIGPSRLESGAYDLTQILPPSSPIIRDDELWFYYTGLKWRGSFEYVGKFPNGKYVPIPGKDRDGGAICLAVLRRDGFVSLDAGSNEGSLTTRQFKSPPGKLRLNVDAKHGEVRVIVLDADGRPIARSKAVHGNQPKASVSFDKPISHGQTISLKFIMRYSNLYAYWFDAS
jgi:hypothetical protein